MDKIVTKHEFYHNDETKYDKFVEELDEWTSENRDDATLQDVQKTMGTLANKLTKGKVPEFESKGWDQAKYALNETMYVARQAIDDNETKLSQMRETYLDFVLQLMDAGPCALHMHLVVEVLRESDMSDYPKTLTGAKLTRLVTALVKDVKPTEKISDKDFYSQYDSYIGRFQSDFTTEEILKAHMKAFMDFHCRLYFNYWDKSEEVCRTMALLGSDIFRELNQNQWEVFDDIPSIKSYFQSLIAIYRNPKLSTAHGRALDELKSFVDTMCNKLGTRGLIEELCDEEFDLLMAIGQCSYPADEDKVQRTFSEALDFIGNLKEQQVQKRAPLFQKAKKRYVEGLEKLDMKFIDDKRFAYTVMDDLLEPAYGQNKQLNGEWIGLLVPLLKIPCMSTIRACREITYNMDAVKWKEHPNIAQEVFNQICKVHIPDSYDEKKRKDYAGYFTDVTKGFLDGLKKSRMLKDFGAKLILLSVTIIEMKDENLYDMAEDIAENSELNVKENKDTIMEVVSRVHIMIKSDDFPWDECWDFQRAVVDVIESLLDPVKDAKTYTIQELSAFLDICRTCQKYECLDPKTLQFASDRYLCMQPVMNKVLAWLGIVDQLDIAEDLIPGIFVGFEEEDETLYSVNSCFFGEFSKSPSGQKALGKYLGQLLQLYLDIDCQDLLRPIEAVYHTNTKAFRPYYERYIVIMLESGDQSCTIWMGQLFHKVSKMQSDLFTEPDMKSILERAKSDINNQPTLLQILQELCKRRPGGMIKHMDLFMDTSGWTPMLYTWINDMLCALALHDKKVAPKVVDFLLKIVQVYQDKATILTGLNAVRLIGFKYPDILKPKRDEIQKMAIADTDGQGVKVSILEMIDGKTPKDLQKQLSQQQSDLNDLVGRVEDTEEAVTEVKAEVKSQHQDLDTVKQDVNEQGERLDQVEETVDETVAKVEEIDQKTLSHAPYWSRDVSKLLTPQSEHDWRLLSSRLGYSNNDIRGWAQQADPCMAMLNEWYATRKTSEATFAIYTQLVEMDRMDVAIILENAMKNAEAVVEDEEFEYASPPPVFISYQWSHQEEVKLLKKHLEMAGYECWLDIGQMGGGDKLFEKIDSGIRAAQLVISCVTTKYAKSPNCNREVNLSVNLNKPMIPLLLEKCTWPPPGSMGPIFSEYLFIRFFQRTGEETEDDRFWPKDKFQELLMQLNTLGLPPDEGKIEPLYRNWWMPVVEEIKIDKSRTKDGGSAAKNEQDELDKKAALSPDVFISYQWGKQKNIIRLYQRLTSLGLTCWLDIKQMGGGDSLYDKIDRGLRGCKVVLSCVTQKYSLSANCRREVSLADALKKPLLPLLLESMTWPPSGPMSMIMTQLLYIDFSEDRVQTEWDGPKFEELLDKIEKHVPCGVPEESPQKDAEKRPEILSSVPAAARGPDQPKNKAKTQESSGEKQPRKENNVDSFEKRQTPKSKENLESKNQKDAVETNYSHQNEKREHQSHDQFILRSQSKEKSVPKEENNAGRKTTPQAHDENIHNKEDDETIQEPKSNNQNSDSRRITFDDEPTIKTYDDYDYDSSYTPKYSYADVVRDAMGDRKKNKYVRRDMPWLQKKKRPQGPLPPPSQQTDASPSHRPPPRPNHVPEPIPGSKEPQGKPDQTSEQTERRKNIRPPPSQQAAQNVPEPIPGSKEPQGKPDQTSEKTERRKNIRPPPSQQAAQNEPWKRPSPQKKTTNTVKAAAILSSPTKKETSTPKNEPKPDQPDPAQTTKDSPAKEKENQVVKTQAPLQAKPEKTKSKSCSVL